MDSPNPHDELVEEIDDLGRVRRIVPRSVMRANRLRHRATFIVVRDGEGRLLTHQRSAYKDVWPSRWDLAAGGCVTAGEDWAAAAKRELAEELGLVAEPTYLGSGSFADDAVDVLGQVYLVDWDPDVHGHVHFADGEVVAAVWMGLDEIDRRIAAEPAMWVPDSREVVLPLIRVAE